MHFRSFVVAAWAAAVLAVLPLSPALAAVNHKEAERADPLARSYDVRQTVDALVTPTTAQVDAMRHLVTVSGARAWWDPRFGTPRSINKSGGYLTAPRTGAARDIARDFINTHRDAFGLTAADVAALAVKRDHVLPGTGTHVVTFQQVIGGVETAQGGRLIVAVRNDGRVLTYAGDPIRSSPLAGSFSLTSAQALLRVAGTLAPAVDFAPEAVRTQAGYEVFAAGPFAASSYVRPVAFPTSSGPRAAYNVLFVKGLDAGWNTVVDATSGEILFRASMVRFASEGTIYENYPGAARGGTPVVKSFGPTPQSPSGWVDPTGIAGLEGATTIGNNANTYANYSNFIGPADQAPRPVSPTSQFHYVYNMNWQSTNGGLVPPSYVLDLNPAATNLFYHHNRIHDEYYALGFTETAGNFQNDGGDPVLGLVHAGAASGGAPTYTGRDNAYFFPFPDGIPSWSGMFLWEPINDAFETPYTDGNFDAGVIEHEYAHGLSSRYVGGGMVLNDHQAGSMGEGWSDWYALDYLYRNNLQSTSVVGIYVTGNTARGIRNWPYDENPLTFGDIGYDLPGPEVHSDGEIWTAMLWDLRKRLVAAHGELQGREIAARLITDAMPLTAPEPSFLEARNGILAADLDRYNGAFTDLIWEIFAKRGAGFSAANRLHAKEAETDPDKDDANDTDPRPAFDHPTASRNGTLVGTIVNASNDAPVANARVIIGEFEARVSPLVRSSSTGGFAMRAVDGTYTVTIQAHGFGAQTFRGLRVRAGKSNTVRFKLAPNLASRSTGATIVSASSADPGLPAEFLIDDTEASVWGTMDRASAYNSGPKDAVVVKLAKPAAIKALQISAMKNTAHARFSAMKDFTVAASDDGVNWQTIQTGTFTHQAPRPVAPDLHYKWFELAKPVTAQYLRLTIDSIQGETVTYAQAAELQAFGRAGAVEATAPLPNPTFVEEGLVATGNPSTGEIAATVIGVTGTEFQQRCPSLYAPPLSQGVDGWITKVPSGYADGTHTISVAAGDAVLADYDVYFMDSRCNVIGSIATSAVNEEGVLPGGVVYVLSQLWWGNAVPVKITIKPGQ